MQTRILLLAADVGARRRIQRWLGEHGFAVAAHGALPMALAALHAEDFDRVAVLDDHQDAAGGAAALREERPDLPVLLAGPEPEALEQALAAAPQDGRRRRMVRLPPPRSAPFDVLVGTSEEIGRLRADLSRIVDVDAPVLLLGETGVGKELVARALHSNGPRSAHPFVAVNCAAIPEGLLESELFGHERGSFTSAFQARFGLFATANGGTLLLDEIQSLPLALQPKLLTVLEDRFVRPLGSRREIPFDVRLVCASNADLHAERDAGRFRADLLFRLDVLCIEIPPLREHAEDIPVLAETFLRRLRPDRTKPLALSAAARETLLAHPWPGNVRELMHALEAAAALATGDRVEVDDLPEDVRERRGPSRPPARPMTLADLRRHHARAVLDALDGNKRRAAEVLGIPRQRLYRLLRA